MKVGVGKGATTDGSTIVVERRPNGKMRATSGSWDGEKIFFEDRVLKVHNVASTRP